MNSHNENLLWEDKEVQFDIANLQKKLRNGENALDLIVDIEDTKGNPGESGFLMVTSLRVIWYSRVHKKYNLSIGFALFNSVNLRSLRGNRQALYILAIFHETRYEFFFSDAAPTKRDGAIFASVSEVLNSYQRTSLYRDLRLRGAIIQGSQLILLPREQIVKNVQGVWNLSSDQGNLGAFVLTDVRLVWFADSNATFNISLPYLQIEYIRVRESKYGPALVIQTASTGGGYVLGFRIDPHERLKEILKELCSLHSNYSENPNLGVDYDLEKKRAAKAAAETEDWLKIDELDELDELQEREVNSKLNIYLAENSMAPNAQRVRREPIYCKELGFAMERLPNGYELSDLWNVIPAKMEISD